MICFEGCLTMLRFHGIKIYERHCSSVVKTTNYFRDHHNFSSYLHPRVHQLAMMMLELPWGLFPSAETLHAGIYCQQTVSKKKK